MGIRRITKGGAKSKKEREARVTSEPLTDRISPLICNDKFVELFNLFCAAVTHEVGNAFIGLKLAVFRQKPELMRKLEKLESVFRRIDILGSLAKKTSYLDTRGGADLFTDKEKEVLNIRQEDDKYTADLPAIRKIALRDVRRFRKMLGSFENSELELSEKASRIFVFGKVLTNSLEKLLLGDLDLDVDLVRMKVGGKTSSVKADITEVRKLSNSTLNFEYQREGVKEAHVKTNPVFLLLITKNILSNSERAMNSKGLEPHIDIEVYGKNGNIIFEFSDKGCGMETEIMKRLNSGEQVTTKDEGGIHGLGFQYCRGLAEKMNGRLYVSESIIGEGTTVALELKIVD